MSAADTIYALATGSGTAAIAVIRLSGPRAVQVIEAMSRKSLPPRQAVRVRLSGLDGLALDDALAVSFPEGASFTGEAVGELHVHGGRAVVSAVLSDLAARGLRHAEPGEFTRRAFGNGKLDLVEIEGLADLLAARTEGQRRHALRQLEGEASAVFEGWRFRLVRLLAHAEAVIDFADEAHVAEAVLEPMFAETMALISEIEGLLSAPSGRERMREGFRLVLAGSPNVGKSSVFNCLVDRDAAMVSALPGTTRDVIEAFLDFGGLPVLLADTAGLRTSSPDPLELEGMRRSQERLENADLVLWLAAADSEFLSPSLDSEPLWIWNKADLLPPPADGRNWLAISAKTGDGFVALEAAVRQRLEAQLDCGGDDVLITRDRHRQALAAAAQHLKDSLSDAGRRAPELFAEELRQAAGALGRLTGRVDVEDLLDVIFRDFCIGK